MRKSTEANKGSNWAELREAQSMTLKLANTGQAVLIDIGESNDIHPRNKKDVGERLARIALAKDYGKAVIYSGPVYSGVKFENGKAIVSFKHTEGGLVAKPVPDTQILNSSKNLVAPLVRNSPTSQLEGFAICGEDKNWVWADAKIEGETVLVWSSTVATPVAVRYGWASNPTCNLYNGSELPASPFRTDNYPEITRSSKLFILIALTSAQQAQLIAEAGFAPTNLCVRSLAAVKDHCTCEELNLGILFKSDKVEIPHLLLGTDLKIEERT